MSDSSAPAPVRYEFVEHIPPRQVLASKWRWLFDVVEDLVPGQILRFEFPDMEQAKKAKMSLTNYDQRRRKRLPNGYRVKTAQRAAGGPDGAANLYVTLVPINKS